MGIILLLALVQPLSAAMSAEESGITAMLMVILDPIFGGRSPIFFMVVIGLIATVVTNFMNNGAIGVALMPIVYSYCTAAGISPQLSVIMVCHVRASGFLNAGCQLQCRIAAW